MRAYLLVTGIIFAFFAAMHFVIAVEHWRRPNTTTWDGLAPFLIGVAAAALTVWAVRLVRGSPKPA